MQFTRDFDHFVNVSLQAQIARQTSARFQQLRKIADTERHVQEFEQEVTRHESKAARIKKQVDRDSPFRKKSPIDNARLRNERQMTLDELDRAKRRLNAARNEAEVIKMFQFRQGMMVSTRAVAAAPAAAFTPNRQRL